MILSETLPPPTTCDNCKSSQVVLISNFEYYKQIFPEKYLMYICNSCKASVTCHKDTNLPMGKMANKHIKSLRIKAHEAFDKIWQIGIMARHDAYNWLAKQLNVDYEKSHIAWFDEEQLLRVIEISNDLLKTDINILKRREAKRNERIRKQLEREERRENLKFDKFAKSKANRRHRRGGNG